MLYLVFVEREDVFIFAAQLLTLWRCFLEKWKCVVCGWVYDPDKGDPDNGVEPGTNFEEIPEDWVCPECGAGKSDFEKVDA